MRPAHELAHAGLRGRSGHTGGRPSSVVGHPTGRRAVIAILLACGTTGIAGGQGRRVVDGVKVGDAIAERAHDYAGERVSDGLAEDGRRFRQALGWQRYTLAVYDDSEVALSFTFRGSEGRLESFDLMVEGRKVAAPTFTSLSAVPATIEIRLPMALTAGKTSLIVVLRAVDGPTPGLIELYALQEHLERPLHAGRHAESAPTGTSHGSRWPVILVASPAPLTVMSWPPDTSAAPPMGDLV